MLDRSICHKKLFEHTHKRKDGTFKSEKAKIVSVSIFLLLFFSILHIYYRKVCCHINCLYTDFFFILHYKRNMILSCDRNMVRTYLPILLWMRRLGWLLQDHPKRIEYLGQVIPQFFHLNSTIHHLKIASLEWSAATFKR